jgi:hypothetical protein
MTSVWACVRGRSQPRPGLLVVGLARTSPPRRLFSLEPPISSSELKDASRPAGSQQQQQQEQEQPPSPPRHGLTDHNNRLRRDRLTRIAFAAELLQAGHFPGQIAQLIQQRLGSVCPCPACLPFRACTDVRVLASRTEDRLAVSTIRGYLIEKARADPAFYATVAFNWKRIVFEGGFLHDCETLEAAIEKMDEIESRTSSPLVGLRRIQRRR